MFAVRSADHFLKILSNLSDRYEFVCDLVRNCDAVFIFKGHYEFHSVKRIGAEVIVQVRFGGDGFRIDIQLFRNNFLNFFKQFLFLLVRIILSDHAHSRL